MKLSIGIAFRAQGDTASGLWPHSGTRLPPCSQGMAPAAGRMGLGVGGCCCRMMGTMQPGSAGQAEKLAGSGLELLHAAEFATRLLCLNTSPLRVSLVQAAALRAVSAPMGNVQQSKVGYGCIRCLAWVGPRACVFL